MRLSANGAPAGGSLNGGRRSSLGFGSAAEHDTTSKNGGFAAIIRRHLVLRRIDEDPGLPGSLAARQLEPLLFLRERFGSGRREGRHGRIGIERVKGVGGSEGEARTRVGRAGAGARVSGDGR